LAVLPRLRPTSAQQSRSSDDRRNAEADVQATGRIDLVVKAVTGVAKRGVTHVETSGTAFDYPTGYAAAIEMFDRPDRPDAVFCANDLLAMCAIDPS
jgi:DNA-binding LacI/PurR family transcriptional regulator